MYLEVKIAIQNTKKTKQAQQIEKNFTLIAICTCIIKMNDKRQKKNTKIKEKKKGT